MTCIIGLVHEGFVYIGGDSAATGGYETRVTTLKKVFRNPPFVMGYTSSFRMGQILEHHLSATPQGSESVMSYMVRTFVEAVRGKFKELGYARVENSQEEGGTFLVGYRGGLYLVDADFQINQYEEGFEAIGVGREYALGAMMALAHLGPRERILKALEIAGHFCDGVRPPFYVVQEDL